MNLLPENDIPNDFNELELTSVEIHIVKGPKLIEDQQDNEEQDDALPLSDSTNVKTKYNEFFKKVFICFF